MRLLEGLTVSGARRRLQHQEQSHLVDQPLLAGTGQRRFDVAQRLVGPGHGDQRRSPQPFQWHFVEDGVLPGEVLRLL